MSVTVQTVRCVCAEAQWPASAPARRPCRHYHECLQHAVFCLLLQCAVRVCSIATSNTPCMLQFQRTRTLSPSAQTGDNTCSSAEPISTELMCFLEYGGQCMVTGPCRQ